MSATSPRAATRTAVFPVATPAILGLYAFSGSLLPIACWLAKWYGNQESPHSLAPFVFMFGGIAQLTAAIWGFAARQWLTTTISSVWSLQHFAWGTLYLMYSARVLAEPQPASPGEGFWYIPLALFSFSAAVPAARGSATSAATLVLGGLGAALSAIALLSGVQSLNVVAGYVLIATSLTGWYTATAMLLRHTYGRPLLPVGVAKAAEQLPVIDPGADDPGVRRGE